MSHSNDNRCDITLYHTLLSEQIVNCSQVVYKIQLVIKNNTKHDIDRLAIKENLLKESTLTLKSINISPADSGLTPVNPETQPLLVKEGFLIDPERSTLDRCCSAVITYELMTSKSGCNYQQLSSSVMVERRCKIFDISSIVIGINVCCEPQTTCVSQTAITPTQVSCPVSFHECEGFTALNPAVQGGEVILNAFINNQAPNKCLIYGLPGSSIFQWDQILQNAIDANKIRQIHITNESCGGYAAQNFSDLKEGGKKVGVVFSTRGPGIMVTSVAIASAFREELPLVYVAGVSPTDRQDEFQNVDLTILSKITKKVFRITKAIKCTNQLSAVIDEACFTAINGTCQNPGRGPVAVLVDLDVWRNPMGVSCCYDFVPKPVLTGNEENALYDIVTRWNDPNVKAVVIRVGPRVYSEKAQMLIDLAKKFKQLYIVTTFDGRGLLNPASGFDANNVNKFFDMQGPVGNKVANAAVNYALVNAGNANNPKFNGVVIDMGVGVLYTTLSTDVTGNVIRLFDEPIDFDGYLVNVNNVIQRLWDNQAQLNSLPSYPTWSPALPYGGSSTLAFKAIADTYLAQIPTNPGWTKPLPSLGYYVTKCLTNFYNADYIVTKDFYFVTDSGTATFIAGQMLRNSIPDNDAIYTEFSAIGLGIGSTAGKVWRNEKDAVLFIGDGGFLNLLGHLVDLQYAAIQNNRRVLFLYFNDYYYGNVALGDLVLFGAFTSITSTLDLMNTVNVDKYFKSLTPSAVLQTVDYATFPTGTDLDAFVTGFKNSSPGFTAPGVYVLRMNGYTTKILTPTDY